MRDALNVPAVAGSASWLGRCLCVFGILGPLFGYLVEVVVVASPVDSVTEAFQLPLGAAVFAPLVLPLAYLFGAIPAVLVGTLYWASRFRIHLHCFTATAICTLAAALVCVGVSVFVRDPNLNYEPSEFAAGTLVAAGVTATLLCVAVVEFMVWRKRSGAAPRGQRVA